MTRRALPYTLLLLPLLFSACDKTKADESQDPEAGDKGKSGPKLALASEHPIGKQVVDIVDPTVDPCEDFYQFACGGWIATTKLPDDKPRWGRGFGELSDSNNAVLKDILEKDQDRAGKFYTACMNDTAINTAGIAPLKPMLGKIDKLKDKDPKALFKLLGELDGTVGLGAFFSFGLSLDFAEPSLHIADLGQGGTGLPDRSFYLDPAKKQQVLPAYQAHVGRMLGFLGYAPADAEAAAARVIALETKLAELQKAPEDMREPESVYHRWDRKGVEAKSKLPWATYFKALGTPKLELINVSNPEFITGLPQLIAEADPVAVKDYLRFMLISSTANLLSDEIVDANFQFTAALTGAKQLSPRWERCVGSTNAVLGDLVSKQFIDRTFPSDSKDIALDMIRRIEAAFVASLPQLSWMDDATRTAAVGKMEKIDNRIGYPDKWRTYEGLAVSGDYFQDTLGARTWWSKFQLGKVGTQVDEAEWNWPASIVNAGYNPLQNEMQFPAGILQPPFFNKDFPKAMNFGAMGMVMGHELSHGFDDQGRKFDGDGVMREWWAPEVASRYTERTQCIVDTYDAIEVQPGVKLNGKLTLGENIADFGGIKQAYMAYTKWASEGGGETPIVEGLTNEQLLFVAYAQSWCTISSPEIDALLATVDPHSPPKSRVNVPLAHLPAFWSTFSCGEGTKMHAENACEVW
ncbi:M13 family metallopeptidase [Nannocystaceae bacterium ST9]